MPTIISLNHDSAVSIWNNFAFSQSFSAPFSFNPSLFNFFQNHFEWQAYYFLLYENNEMVGLFPLVNTGQAWVSLPHFSYGGILSNNKIKKIFFSVEKLIEEVKSLELESGFYRFDIAKADVRFKEIKEKYFIRTINCLFNESFVKSEKVTSVLELHENREEFWKTINPNLKRKINKAKKSAFVVKIGGIELLDDFYEVYSRNIFELNSLNYSKKFFINLFSDYNFGEIKFFVAYNKKKPVGSSLLASYNNFYENLYFATASDYRKFYLSDLIHWEMINFSSDNEQKRIKIAGGRTALYSFGRSTVSSGVYKYKHHWPVKDYTLYYYANISDVRKNRWLQKVWGLLPYFISKPVGTYLIKHIY